MTPENPYSYGSRNNSKAYSAFTHRLPRFEYRSPPFAFTQELEDSECGPDYPYDRRGPDVGLDAILESIQPLCSINEVDSDIFLETVYEGGVSDLSQIEARNVTMVQVWEFDSSLVLHVEDIPDGTQVESAPGVLRFILELGDMQPNTDLTSFPVVLKVDAIESQEGDYEVNVSTSVSADNADNVSGPHLIEGGDSCNHYLSVCPIVDELEEDFNSYENGSITELDKHCHPGNIFGVWVDLVQEDFNSYDNGEIFGFGEVLFAEWAFVVSQQPPLVYQSNTEFTMPENVKTLKVFAVGRGQDGGVGRGPGGGGGGVNYAEYEIGEGPGEIDVQPGDKFTIEVGGSDGGTFDSKFVHEHGLIEHIGFFGGSTAGGKSLGCAPCGTSVDGDMPIPGQGNRGGSSVHNAGACTLSDGSSGCQAVGGASGGGAGEQGSDASAGTEGSGGDGLFFSQFEFLRIGRSGEHGWFGGGGGGAGGCDLGTPGAGQSCARGGKGGGGNATRDSFAAGGNGIPGTGGGGGGARSSNTPGGQGGSGIIIIDWEEE